MAAVCLVSLVLGTLATPPGTATQPRNEVAAAAPPAEAAPPRPPGAFRAGAILSPTYYYASAQSQYIGWARGAKARFTIHRPAQVHRSGDHSLAEIAIRGPHSSDIIEAGWRTDSTGVTRLFVYWWKNGQPQCYNGCGFVRKGPGIKPGSVLQPGTAVTLKWVFRHGKWKLKVNGKMAGYYPKRLWHGRFKKPRVVQVFGEVVTTALLPCADMGSGRPAWWRKAAKIARVKFVRGPRLRLSEGKVSGQFGYSMRLVNNRKMKYGGRGLC